MPSSQVFFYSLIIFVAGIILGNFFALLPLLFCSLALMFIFLAIIAKNYLRVLMIFLACLFFGCWRFQIAVPDFTDSNKIYHYNSSTVEFIGQIKSASSGLSFQTLVVEAETLNQNKDKIPVSGRVKITVGLYPEYRPGDQLKISCKLKDYRQTENVGYANYLFKENIFSVGDFATVNLIGSDFTFNRLLYQIRQRAKAGVNSSLKEPAAAIMNGMLLNDTKNITAELNQMMSRLGLTHIIAISGSHLVIIIYIIMLLLLGLGFSRTQSFWPAVGLIIFYVLLVGAPASAVRSAVMAIMVMYAQKIGRLSASKSLLAMAAAVMALINPKSIQFDVGFQLSFLAIVGLSYFSPLFQNKLKFLPEKFGLTEIAVATFSAQLLTYPLIIFYFGNFSPYSFFANLLILPAVPPLMIFGLIDLMASLISFNFGYLLGWPVWLLIKYWLLIAGFFYHLPLANWPVNFSAGILAMIYFLIFLFYVIIKKKRKVFDFSVPNS